MDTFETEEQQIEAIKKWWHENYKSVVAALILGVGGILGVQYWKQQQMNTAGDASIAYDALLDAVSISNSDEALRIADTLIADYADTSYAELAAAIAAKQLVDTGKVDQAVEKLQWVILNGDQQEIVLMARLNLARLHLTGNKPEEALKVLEVEAGSFNASFLELKGDILVAQGKTEEARKSYDEAIQAYTLLGADNQILKVKRNDLGNS